MKKVTKIIDGDKVTIYEGRQIDFDDSNESNLAIDENEWKPNPYAKRLREQKNKLSVELDADIAKYFKNSREVNLFIRKQIELVQKLVT